MARLYKRIDNILATAAENVIRRAKANLEDGQLKNSLRYEPKGSGSIKIIMEDYGIFKDKGVTGANHSDFKGKRKKINRSVGGFKFNKKVIKGEKSIDRWMYKKGIQGRDKAGRFIKRKTTNFLIRRSIAQHGIKPSLFLTKPYERFLTEIKQEFNNLGRDLIKDINESN
tara:strand:+ start:1487 stop:1996 length:510 start_codon:yes stop_codon:yes gene_type:complete